MRGTSGTARLLVRLAALSTVACIGGLALWSMLPAVVGWRPTVVMSGSMRPSIEPGDVVTVRHVPAGQLRAGQVVLVPDPDHAGRLRLHRVQRTTPDGRIVLRGDANRAADSSRVRADDVIGVAVLRAPFVGLPTKAFIEHDWGTLVAMLAGLGTVIRLALGGRGGDVPPDAPQRPRGRARPAGRGRKARALVRRMAVLGGVPLLVMLGSTGFARFAVAAANPTSQFTAAASFYPYRDAVLADTPVLYWRLGETSGTAAANTATTGPAGTYYSTPALGQASALATEVANKSVSTTTSGFVTAATAVTAPSQFTVEAWIKTSTTAGGRVFGFGNNGTTTLSTTVDRQLYLSPGGKVVAGLRNPSLTKVVATSPLSYNDGLWHHLATSYNGTILRLYVDGAQVASTTTTAAATFSGYWRAASENLTGWPTPPSGNNYAGGLDELAVYATALSATRISAHFLAATS